MRLGGTVCCSAPAEWEEKLVASGFRAVTAPFTCDTPREEIRRLTDICEKHDVLIAEVGVWRNLFDRAEGPANLDFAVRQLRLADELGIPCCVNVAGTDSPAGWDAADPGNFSEEMYRRLVASIRTIIDSAKPKTACYCLEPMPWMLPDSPDVTLQLMKDVDRESFAVHMDFVNMINCPRRYLDAEGFIEECFAKLGPYIKSTHLKDSRMDLMELTTVLHECSPGEGGLDFVRVLRIIDRYLPADAPVLLEHMSTFDEYRRAYDYVAAKAGEAGVGI
ncbi:MAG: sugar phosphate isomerase/epimerase [Clostridia bacterium]|nr:sugar phosphate isomerase/epimerase [Clostridia bacterium]